VAAEALACGTPLVCTRCGGPEEFVGPDDGVLVPADDPQALCDGILRALDERERFDGAGIAQRVTARFGRAAWSDQALAMYRSLGRGAPR
jgi:glycosyltransferase involved in cell wall biosynthesis